MDQIIHKLEIPDHTLMDNAKMKRVLQKVPEQSIIDDYNARNFLSVRISIINEKVTIDEICSGIRSQSISEHSEHFNDHFQQWLQKPVDREYLKNVAQYIPSMTNKYTDFYEKFNQNLCEVNEKRKTVDDFIKLTSPSFDSLLEAEDPIKIRHIVQELGSITKKICEKQESLFKAYRIMLKTIRSYNIDRTQWAEYLIGMRKKCEFHDEKAEKGNVKPRKKSIGKNLIMNRV